MLKVLRIRYHSRCPAGLELNKDPWVVAQGNTRFYRIEKITFDLCTGIFNQQSHPDPDKACPPLRLFLPDDQLQIKLKPAVWRSNGKAGNLKIEISKPKLPANSDAKQADRSLSSLARYCALTAQSAAGETLTSGFACSFAPSGNEC